MSYGRVSRIFFFLPRQQRFDCSISVFVILTGVGAVKCFPDRVSYFVNPLNVSLKTTEFEVKAESTDLTGSRGDSDLTFWGSCSAPSLLASGAGISSARPLHVTFCRCTFRRYRRMSDWRTSLAVHWANTGLRADFWGVTYKQVYLGRLRECVFTWQEMIKQVKFKSARDYTCARKWTVRTTHSEGNETAGWGWDHDERAVVAVALTGSRFLCLLTVPSTAAMISFYAEATWGAGASVSLADMKKTTPISLSSLKPSSWELRLIMTEDWSESCVLTGVIQVCCDGHDLDRAQLQIQPVVCSSE